MVTESQAEADPQEHLGRDIALSDSDDVRLSSVGDADDFQKVNFSDNLKQALINRLRTGKGELPLHPDYGSRLSEVLGTTPTNETLLLVKSFTRDALLQEPRIESIDGIKISFRDETTRKEIDIEVDLTPIKDLEPLNLVFRLFIDGFLVGGPN